MLTRAKRGLIVIGNTNLLKVDTNWNKWITFMEEQSLIIDKF